MNSFSRNTHRFILIGFIGWLSLGCNNGTLDEATPDAQCRIQQSVAVSKSKFYDQTSRTTYEYNTQGNLVKTAVAIDKRPAGGAVGNQTGTKTVTHTYDANDYLTASTTEELYVTTTNQTIREQITTTQSYSYVNNRLSGYTTKRIGAYGITTTTTDLFTYDASGDLLTKTETTTHVVHDPTIATEIPTGSTGVTRVWTYQRNQLVDYVERTGTSESRPLTIQNGVITKQSGSNYEIRFEYDSQQRVTKQENYLNGQLNDYYRLTWIDAKPAAAAVPVFKGFPVVGFVPESREVSVPASRQSFYRNSVSGQMQLYQESIYAIQTNAQGFVSSATTTVKHPNPAAADQDYTTTETYTYTGCQ